MQIECMILGEYATNCYILSGGQAGRCVLIDPADDAPRLLARLDSAGLVPEAVLLTHGHYDHLLAVPGLQARWPALPVYCHPLDIPEDTVEYEGRRAFPTVAAFANLRTLCEGGRLELAGLTFTVLHTPGHTPGSVTFQCEQALFTGDTLFLESIGRTDFAGGDERQMAQSLARLAALPLADCPVYPGHDSPTTLAHERRFNPWLRFAQR